MQTRRIIRWILYLLLLPSIVILAQSTFDVFGYSQNLSRVGFRNNSLESNPGNINSSKEWQFSAVFGSEISNRISNNIYLVSISKRFGNNYFYGRYTPGFNQEFNYKNGTVIPYGGDISLKTELTRTISYQENFGLGYSYNFDKKFSAGFSLRSFTEKYSEDVPNIFADTSSSTIQLEQIDYKNMVWRGDLGFSYNPYEELRVSLMSNNLIYTKSGDVPDDYQLRRDKTVILGIDLETSNWNSFHGMFESNTSFVLGTEFIFGNDDFRTTFGISAIRDKYQKPFIAGIMPVLNLEFGAFSLNISGVKYFSKRGTTQSAESFFNEGIQNIINNPFSHDRVFTSISFALSSKAKKLAKIIDVEILKDIYPTLSEKYTLEPIALLSVKSMSDKTIKIKAFSFIPNINNEPVLSPSVTIAPNKTINIPIFTLIENNKSIEKRLISTCDFSIVTENGDVDDKIQKPILINDKNAWDGNISTLKYFVKSDYQFANKFAKLVLNKEKDNLLNQANELATFEKIKVLFDDFIRGMTYVADPRSTIEFVQYPNETIKVKGGDCDDLSTAFSAILESIGIQTAFVDFKNDDGISHVNLLVNTKLQNGNWKLITKNEKKIFMRKDRKNIDNVWIPIEMTSLTDFNKAWEIGAEKFYKSAINEYGLSTGKVEIIEIY